jgi:nucleoside-diphosphate-sugar epimerase
MRAAVTGSTGFLGRRLVPALLRQAAEVSCLVRPSSDLGVFHERQEGDTGQRPEIKVTNLSDVNRCADALAGCDVLYHLAAELRGAPAVLFLNNVIGTRRLLEAARQAGVARIVLVSSLGVYGTSQLRPGDVLDESCPLDPKPHQRDAYSYSKIVQEEVAWEAHKAGAASLVVVRPGVIYGPGRDCISARIGLRVGSFLIRMGGRQQLPYIFVDNCADGVLRAGIAAGVEGKAFNLVDDGLLTGRELLAQYRAVIGPIRSVAVPHSAIDPLSGLCEWYHQRSRGQLPAVLTRYKSAAQWKPLCYSNTRAKEALGWKPEISSSEGLSRTLAWLRAQANARCA